MKLTKSYILTAVGALALGWALAGCQDHFDDYQVEVPQASIKPNMTILELKQAYWDDATNFIDTIGIHDDKDYIIAGRVVSSDEAGNVFKSLVIQDETAALAISINSYNLYLKYRIGQEIVIDLKGMYIGKYNGLLQLGMPEWYESGNAWEATFMAPEYFEQHIQLNGLPEAAKIDTLEINTFSELPNNPDGLCRFQSRIVKFNNVYFQNAGDEQFSEYHSSGVNQNIVDANGSTLPVRTSGYSNFWNQYLPQGNGDVVCILSYYGTTGWQLLLNDYEGCMNFGNPTIAPGTASNPYTVMDAIATIQSDANKGGWVSGYIVGAVAPEVTSVKSNDDIEWSSDVVMNNTLVIGATPDTKDISQSLLISLPQGSALRQYGNLADHPENYKRAISVNGRFGMVMDSYGITNNNGSADSFNIEGVDASGTIKDGNGTESAPYNVAQVIAMNPTSTTDAVASDVWVTGFIVGYMPSTNTYLSNSIFSADDAVNTNLVLGPSADCTDYTKCISVQLPFGDVRDALNLKDNPANLGKQLAIKGNVMKYCGGPGLKNGSEFKLDGQSGGNTGGDQPNPGGDSGDIAEGAGSEASPYNVAQVIAMNPTSTSEAVATDVWVAGFIVGSIPAGGSVTLPNTEFGTANPSASNMVIGPSPDCKDYSKCIAIQLPVGDIRSALNLMDNPGNLGRRVDLKGSVMKYCSGPGLKNLSAYKLGEGGSAGGDQPTPDPNPGSGAGTLDSPYTPSQALAIIAAGSYTSDKVYISGTISRVKEISTSYGNATYFISDNGSSDQELEVFRGYGLGGAKFTSETEIKAGDKVIIHGQLTLYNTTPEVTTGSSIYSLNGITAN